MSYYSTDVFETECNHSYKKEFLFCLIRGRDKVGVGGGEGTPEGRDVAFNLPLSALLSYSWLATSLY